MQEAGVAAGAGRLQHEDLLHDVRIEGAVPCLVIGGGGGAEAGGRYSVILVDSCVICLQ